MTQEIEFLAAPAAAPDTLRLIRSRHKTLLLACFAAPFALLASIALSLPGLFRSSAVLIVQPQPGPGASASESALPGAAETMLHLFTEENLSRDRLADLIARYQLYPELRSSAPMEKAVEQLRRDIQIEAKDPPGPGRPAAAAFAFTVSYTGRDPQRVAEVTNALAGYYVEEGRRRRDQRLAESVRLLEGQLAATRKRLDEEGRLVEQFKSRHLRELPAATPLNLATLYRLNARLDAIREKKANLLAQETPAAVAAQRLEGANVRLARVREELRELQPQAAAGDPELARLEAQVAALSAPLAAEYRALEQEERALRRTIPALEAMVYNAPRREQELQALVPTWQSTRALHDSLLSRLEEATLGRERARNGEADLFQLVERAAPALLPAAPDRLKLLLAALILCGGLALGAGVLAVRRDGSLHSIDELRRLTSVPVLNGIPQIVTQGDAARTRARLAAGAVLLVLAIGAGAAAGRAFAHDNESLVRLLAFRGRS